MNAFWLHNYINRVLLLIGSCCITKAGLKLGIFLFQLLSVPPPPAYQCFHKRILNNCDGILLQFRPENLVTQCA